MKPPEDCSEIFHAVVISELKNLGVKVPKIKKLISNLHKQEKQPKSQCKIFGVNLLEQEHIFENGCLLPKFLVDATKYLNDYSRNEGLFRKSGSLLRQKELRMKIEKGKSWDEAQPNDVASLLKQWLRELPESLIPPYLHDLFDSCLLLSSEDKLQSVLLTCLLLPAENLNSLAYLLSFLYNIVSLSGLNKMDAYNLAIIMTPNLLHTIPDHADKANTVHHTDLVELLISNAGKVGQVPCAVAEQMQGKDQDFGTIELSVEVVDTQKKRHKSGPVYDFVHEIRRLVGQNLTPRCTRNQHVTEFQESHKSIHHSASKRKADLEMPTSSSSKKRTVELAHSQENEQFTIYTPVCKGSCSIDPSSSSRKTALLQLPTSPSPCKSGLLNRKGRSRAKSVSKFYRAGAKWLSSHDMNKPCNLNSSYTPGVKSDKKDSSHHIDCKQAIGVIPPFESSTPAEASAFHFPSLRTSSGSLAVFSPVTSCNVPKTESFVEERENVLPIQMKHPSLSNSKNASTNSVEKCEAFQDVKVVRRQSISKHVSFSPLKVQNNVTVAAEKRVTRNSSRHRSVRSQIPIRLTDSPSCNITLEFNSGVKCTRKSSTCTFEVDKEMISRSTVIFKTSVDGEQSLSELLGSDNSKHSKILSSGLINQNPCSSRTKRLDRFTSRSCTNISDLRTEGSSEKQLAKGSSKKGSTSKSSLRRGRPNTIKTGLPSEFCRRNLVGSGASAKVEKRSNVGRNSKVDLKNSNLLQSAHILVHESKAYTPKNIRT